MKMIEFSFEVVTKTKNGNETHYNGNSFNTFVKTLDDCNYLQYKRNTFYAISTYNGFSDYLCKYVYRVIFEVVENDS